MAPVRPLPEWDVDRTPSDAFPESLTAGVSGRNNRAGHWALVCGGPTRLRYLTFLPLVVLFLVVMRTQDSRPQSSHLSHSMKAALQSARARQAELDALQADVGGPSAAMSSPGNPLGGAAIGAERGGGSTAAREAPRSRPLRVMTYNVWNFDDGPEWEAERLPAIAEAIRRSHPALVGLQELRIRGERDQGKQLLAALQNMGLTYHLEYVKGMQYGDTEEGIGVLSRFPIRRLEVRDLPMGHGDDQNARKCMMVEVDAPQFGAVQFFNTHFSYNVDQQVWNAAEVMRFADELRSAAPQFLVGDLNTPPGRVASVALLTHNQTWLAAHPPAPPAHRWPALDWDVLRRAPPFVDAWGAAQPGAELGGPCDADSCTFSNLEPRTRCDYVLLRGPVTPVQAAVVGTVLAEGAAVTPPSDHRAVVATVRLEAAPP